MKKLLAAVCSAAFLMGAGSALAASDELVWGENLPRGLDPHVVYDVPMHMFMLNAYAGLYRYLRNPPELTPGLADRHPVWADDGVLQRVATVGPGGGRRLINGSDLGFYPTELTAQVFDR